jgi:hypothetical protein
VPEISKLLGRDRYNTSFNIRATDLTWQCPRLSLLLYRLRLKAYPAERVRSTLSSRVSRPELREASIHNWTQAAPIRTRLSSLQHQLLLSNIHIHFSQPHSDPEAAYLPNALLRLVLNAWRKRTLTPEAPDRG